MAASEVFRVSDFGFCAFLLVNGFALRDIASDESASRRKVFLVRGERSSFDVLAERFRAGDASVDAREFLSAQRRLKQVLYGVRASGAIR
jgi:hypothetical protein